MFNMEDRQHDNNMPKIADKTPFVGLEISEDIKGGSADFYDLPGHPELVVRKCYTPVGLEKSIREELEKEEVKKLHLRHGVD